jgi:hypothetical protein
VRASAFRMPSKKDFFGGGGVGGWGRYFLSTVVTWNLVPCRLSLPKLLRDPEFQVGNGHDSRVSRFLGCLFGENIRFLVARCAFVALDPYQIDGFAPPS